MFLTQTYQSIKLKYHPTEINVTKLHDWSTHFQYYERLEGKQILTPGQRFTVFRLSCRQNAHSYGSANSWQVTNLSLLPELLVLPNVTLISYGPYGYLSQRKAASVNITGNKPFVESVL